MFLECIVLLLFYVATEYVAYPLYYGSQIGTRSTTHNHIKIIHVAVMAGRTAWARLARFIEERSTSRKFIGEDLSGNRYYELPNLNGPRPRRMMEPAHTNQRDTLMYDQEAVPPSWRAWLQHSRDEVPTKEELLAIVRHREMAPLLAAARQKEYEEMAAKMALPAKEEAKAIEGSKAPAEATKVEPVGSGESFKPGTWGA